MSNHARHIVSFLPRWVTYASLLVLASALHAQHEPIAFSTSGKAPAKTGREIVPALLKRSLPPRQSPQLRANPRYKTSGREFYVVFPSAVSSSSNTIPVRRVYLAARSFARGRISCMDGSWSKEFEVMPKSLTPVSLPSWAALDRLEVEAAYRRVFKIETEDDIAVYAFSPNYLSSDACLVLPRETLGKEYVIASARNALWYNQGAASSNANNPVPRSEFVVAAIEDGTEVLVNLTAESSTGRYQKGSYYTFTLNRGEVIQFMARDTGRKALVGYWDNISNAYLQKMSWIGKELDSTDCDLTGSRVLASKPVAVFSGHERASVPDDLEFAWQDHSDVSRDHLVEQMPPVEVWGKKFIVIAAKQNEDGNRPPGGDYVRVIARYDGTQVSINGVPRYTLAEGEFRQFQSGDFAVIETTQPALVVKYLATAQPDIDPLAANSTGDPDMTIVPPIENMSTFYSIPTTYFDNYFTEHYIALVIDTGAFQTTLLNGYQPDMTSFKALPGNLPYMFARFRTEYEGEQRVESSLPCYAETYGYGDVDSYSFSGGGDFHYIKGLSANDLNFGFVKLGDARDSLTTALSTISPSPLADTLVIFRYSWESGDTNVFSLLDTIRPPLKLAPGESLPVAFSFKPKAEGAFSAKLRLWSNNMNPVYIRVFGLSGIPCLQVENNLIDFGRVRVQRTSQAAFFYGRSDSNATALLKFDDADFQSQLSTPFSINPDQGGANQLVSLGSQYAHQVTFGPKSPGYFSDTINVMYNGSQSCDTPYVYLYGRGVYPFVVSNDLNFGEIRFNTISAPQFLSITNRGDDTTRIVNVRLDSGDISEFNLGIQPQELPKALDTLNSGSEVANYIATFKPAPRADPDKNGLRVARIEIVTDEDTVYQYVRGRGVEPWFTATPITIDFGTITNPLLSDPNDRATRSVKLRNEGTMAGILNAVTLSQKSGDSVFRIESAPAANTMFDTVSDDSIRVSFLFEKAGIFYDTISIQNDSRSQPIIYLKGVVDLNFDMSDTISIDTISNCLPVDTTIRISNPYRVPITIMDTAFTGSPDGFSFYPGVFVNNIQIPPGGEFTFTLRYEFPVDSANGEQTLLLLFTKPTVINGILGEDLDTVRVSLFRKTQLLDLVAAKLPYNPNALDAPFRLPIHIRGDRLGKRELDTMTVKLRFSNEMVKPAGIDRTGSLTESADNIPWTWDESSRTMTIPISGASISTDPTRNSLLFTLLGETYLTVDTMIEIVPEIDYAEKPCAYRITRDSTMVVYANECGDRTIRDLMRSPAFSIGAPYPDPASRAESRTIFVPYIAPRSYTLGWKLYNALGETISTASGTTVAKGIGAIAVGGEQLRTSGLYFIEVTVRDDAANTAGRYVTKFAVTE